jgi:dipeptidase E
MRLLVISNSTNPEKNILMQTPAGHADETKEQRVEEFIEVNPEIRIAGLREGTMFLIYGPDIRLIGPGKARIFKKIISRLGP